MAHRDLAGGDIEDHFGYEEGIETGRSIAMGEIHHFFLESGYPADTAGEDDTYPVYINVFLADTGILHGHIAGSHGQLCKAVRFTGLLTVYILGGIKALHFTGKTCFELGCIELGDHICAGNAVNQPVPIIVQIISEWCNGTDSSN